MGETSSSGCGIAKTQSADMINLSGLLRLGFGGEVLISEQLLDRNVQRFRGGLVVNACRLLYHSTLGVRLIEKQRR